MNSEERSPAFPPGEAASARGDSAVEACIPTAGEADEGKPGGEARQVIAEEEPASPQRREREGTEAGQGCSPFPHLPENGGEAGNAGAEVREDTAEASSAEGGNAEASLRDCEASEDAAAQSARKRRRRRRLLLLLALLLALLFRLPERLLPTKGRILRAEDVALRQLGKPYVFGAAGPDSFDCSGLMQYAYAKVGVELCHNTKVVANDAQYETISDPAELREGDLVFFDTIPGGSRIDHVGFRLRGQRFLQASSAQGKVVISRFDESWQKRFTLAKRILP